MKDELKDDRQNSGKSLVPTTGDAVKLPFLYQPYSHTEIDSVSKNFYVAAMDALNKAGIPFLVGGAYAFAHYAKIERHTKDFDIFVKQVDADRVLECLSKALNCQGDRTYPHWLFKAILGENFIDIIYSSGNGIAIVDDVWFEKAEEGLVLGVMSKLIPAEEMIWSKGFIMERERFDGADVAHIIRGWGSKMEWGRLIKRYDSHWRVLFSHLVLFGYIYPAELETIPDWVMNHMIQLLQQAKPEPTQTPFHANRPDLPSLESSDPTNLCRGTLLSRQQYLKDVAEWRYYDARTQVQKGGSPIMSDEAVAHWTAAAFGHGIGKP